MMKRLRPKRQSLSELLKQLVKEDPKELHVKYVSPIIGKGLFTKVKISRGQYIVAYKGKRLSEQEFEILEDTTYLYVYQYGGKWHRIDATESTGIAKYANDNWISPNAKMERIDCDGTPQLFLKAMTDIDVDTEIRYNYHDESARSQVKSFLACQFL